jgi:ATP-dependent exoDNAse (exonuclease V) alpha subunit
METRGQENIAEVLKKTCLAPEKLELKKGAKVMFIKNNFDRGYVNGTLGKIIGFSDEKLPIVRTFKGENITAMPESWRIEEEDATKAEISQIPLRLAWAITVHKSQGMNLDAAEIDLSKCFLEGMGYVALSRLSALDGLKLMGINDEALLVNQEIIELDKILKQMSQEADEYVKKINIQEKRKSQKQFLCSLPQVARSIKKTGLSADEAGKESISTFEKTKILIAEKLPIKKIAKQRGLTEETIISHLEKIKEKKEDVDLEYLRPLKNRFEKIKTAFQKSGDWLLSPAREILGKDFSYKEIRIARLFLRK